MGQVEVVNMLLCVPCILIGVEGMEGAKGGLWKLAAVEERLYCARLITVLVQTYRSCPPLLISLILPSPDIHLLQLVEYSSIAPINTLPTTPGFLASLSNSAT